MSTFQCGLGLSLDVGRSCLLRDDAGAVLQRRPVEDTQTRSPETRTRPSRMPYGASRRRTGGRSRRPWSASRGCRTRTSGRSWRAAAAARGRGRRAAHRPAPRGGRGRRASRRRRCSTTSPSPRPTGRAPRASSGLLPKPPDAITTAPHRSSSSPTATPRTSPSSTTSRSTRCPSAISTPRARHCWTRTSITPCPRPSGRCTRGTNSSPPKMRRSWNSTPRSPSHSMACPASSHSRLAGPMSRFHWLSVQVVPVQRLGVSSMPAARW